MKWNRYFPPHSWSGAKAKSITITAKIKAVFNPLFPNERAKINKLQAENRLTIFKRKSH